MNTKSSIGLAGLGVIGAGTAVAYLFRKTIFEKALALPPAHYKVAVQRNVRLPMPDGVHLASDLYLPHSKRPLPTVLLRTPYGRSGTMGLPMVFISQRFAERGYNVVCQDVRGRFDSEGEFEPFVHEQADGGATVRWIVAQPWADGQVGMWGPSYLGYVQWAAAAADGAVRALAPLVTQSNMVDLADNGAALDTILRWVFITEVMTESKTISLGRLRKILQPAVQDHYLADGFMHLPISTADEVVLEKKVPFFRTWVKHFGKENDPYFAQVDLKPTVTQVDAPVHFMGGWYDIFLPGLLDDFMRLQTMGKRPYLTIGPWHHFSFGKQLQTIGDTLVWFDAHLKDKKDDLRPNPVQVYVMGADEWRSFDHWPPPARTEKFYLLRDETGDGRLTRQSPPAANPPDHYRYDPADPTPNVAGPLLSKAAGAADNRALESRPDVLTFTTQPLFRDLDVIGPVRLRLYGQSSLPYTDFFGRLCDVQPDGRSLNICDGLLRVEPGCGQRQPDGSLCLEIDLSATAHRFLVGHRIRLQVSSGAHPRVSRNLGTGEPVLTSTRMVSADQTIFHDAAHPSALELPVSLD
ncbi:MAG: CocE/NonD family hydrolase [Chloroflexi bacterium]|nr:CocE/NonD family hydrolase [Chloroflexota bacterium]